MVTRMRSRQGHRLRRNQLQRNFQDQLPKPSHFPKLLRYWAALAQQKMAMVLRPAASMLRALTVPVSGLEWMR